MDSSSKAKNVTLWVISALAAVVFAVAGVSKLIGLMNEMFVDWGYSPSFAIVVGLLEIAGALGLLLPRVAGWAALGLMTIMLGALATHFVNGEYVLMAIPGAVFVLLAGVVWGRGLALEPTTRGHMVSTEHPKPM